MPSTVIKSYLYEPQSQTLRIIYQSGAVYEYLNVPEVEFLQFKSAFSKGIYLNTNIKKKYKFLKIADVS